VKGVAPASWSTFGNRVNPLYNKKVLTRSVTGC
jgi:hypothetical protein